MNSDQRLSRSHLLLGDEVMQRLATTRVIIFGIGGVGSWAAEALVRTGLIHITIVDNDRVALSNINRQLPATINTVGELKVEALREHLLSVNPDARITTIASPYTPETAADFALGTYDYIIDAIDSLSCKAALILHATSLKGVKFYSSMGAALKLDPTRVNVAEFWQVQGCPLARALRQRFKRNGQLPSRKFKCVYSDELVPNRGTLDDDAPSGSTWDSAKAAINGSLLQVTGTVGFTLASLIIKDITETSQKASRP